MIQGSLKPFQSKGSINKPEVSFNAETGQLLLEGRSILENSIAFYEPLLDWLNEYANHPAEKTEFHMKLDYFNTSTSKFLLSIIDVLEEIWSSGKDVLIKWYYGDEDMKELGQDYQHMMEVPIQLIEHQFTFSY